MGKSSLIPLTFCFLFLSCHSHQIAEQLNRPGRRESPRSRECNFERLSAQEPSRRVQSEAGVTEFWDQNDEQFECAGVVVSRTTIEPKGLLLPSFSNAPRLTYTLQGRCLRGVLIPGCPESFQSFQQQEQQQRGESQGQRIRDQHQRIIQIREGDVIATPAGVAYWCYNNGDTPVVSITIEDTSNFQNQLGRSPRKFHIAGSGQSQSSRSFERETSEQESSGNIFSGFDSRILAEALGVSSDLVRKLQKQDERRGDIVRVEHEFQVIRPSVREEEEERQHGRHSYNGLEEAFCNVRLNENVDDASRADVYTPQGGRITRLNGQKLSILNYLQLNAERGVLYQNSLLAPHWNLNSHSIMYVTRGSARVQIVNHQGRSVFNERVQSGQIVVIPQNFVVLKQAENKGFEWISFKTNNNAITSSLVGRNSVLRGLPEDVLVNSFKISREEARTLKYNRGEELQVLSPGSRTQKRMEA